MMQIRSCETLGLGTRLDSELDGCDEFAVDSDEYDLDADPS